MISLRNLFMIVCVLLLQSGISVQAQVCLDCEVITAENAINVELLHVFGDGIARDLAWSADGSQLAVASTLGLYIFDAANPEFALHELAVPIGATRVVAGPYGWIVGIGDGTVLLTDAEGTIQQLTGHIYPITTLELSADSETLISVDQSGVARQWSLETMTEMSVFQTRGDGRAHIVVINPAHDLNAYMGIPEIGGVYLSPDARVVGAFTVPFVAVSFGEGDTVSGFGEEGGVFQWLLQNPDDHPQVSLNAPPHPSTSTLSPDGSLRAEAQADSTVRLFNAATGDELAILRGFIRGVASVAFNPDGTLLAAGSLDGTARLYYVAAVLAAQSPDDEVFSGIVVLDQTRGGHTLGVTGVGFNDDGSLMTTSSYDGTVRLWGVE